MKRLLSVFAIVVLTGAAAFAIETSAGGGLKYTNTTNKFEGSVSSVTMETSTKMSEIALFGFFDATYVQADLGYSMFVGGTFNDTLDGAGAGYDYDYSEDLEGSMTFLTLGVLGKYPFAVGSATVFPLLGFEYKLNLSVKDKDGTDLKKDMTSSEKSNMNEFWLKAGIGADFNVTPKVYVRPSILFGTKFKNSDEKDAVTAAEDAGLDVKYNIFRFDIGAAVGFKL